KIYDDKPGKGTPAMVMTCGETGMMNYKIWDLDGHLLASTILQDEGKKPANEDAPSSAAFDAALSAPVKITPGEGKYPYALELALVGDGEKHGMNPGGKRTLIVPPKFLKTLSGKPADAKIMDGVKLPEKTLLFEVELVNIERPENIQEKA